MTKSRNARTVATIGKNKPPCNGGSGFPDATASSALAIYIQLVRESVSLRVHIRLSKRAIVSECESVCVSE